MNIVVEFSDIDHRRELSITDGTCTYKSAYQILVKAEDVHNWIVRAFDVWLKLKENQKRAEGDEDGLTVYATTDEETLEWLRGQKEKGDKEEEKL